MNDSELEAMDALNTRLRKVLEELLITVERAETINRRLERLEQFFDVSPPWINVDGAHLKPWSRSEP